LRIISVKIKWLTLFLFAVLFFLFTPFVVQAQDISIPVPYECIGKLKGCYLNILEKDSQESNDPTLYNAVVLNKPISISESDFVKISSAQEVFSVYSQDESISPYFPMCYSGSNPYSLSAIVSGPFGPFGSLTSNPLTRIRIDGSISEKQNKLQFEYLLSDEQIEKWGEMPDRNLFVQLGYQATAYIEPEDEAGFHVPCWEWERYSGYIIKSEPVELDAKLKRRSTSQLSGAFYAQVVFETESGNMTCSDLYQLDSLVGTGERVMVTDGIVIKYIKYDDYVMLTSIMGTADEYTLPEEIEGLPVKKLKRRFLEKSQIKHLILCDSLVELEKYALADNDYITAITLNEGITRIPANLFAWDEKLETVNIPATVKSIGFGAFDSCRHIHKLEIPKGVERIADGAFIQCDRLDELLVDRENSYYKTQTVKEGNVLFSKDGKDLIAAPGLYHTGYRIPDNTERIHDFAFYGSYTENVSNGLAIGYGLIDIEFPDSLVYIGNAAFLDCNRLRRIDLPENLQFIGAGAFGVANNTASSTDSIYKKRLIEQVVIPAGVTTFDEDAFAGYEIGDLRDLRKSQKEQNDET